MNTGVVGQTTGKTTKHFKWNKSIITTKLITQTLDYNPAYSGRRVANFTVLEKNTFQHLHSKLSSIQLKPK